MSKLLIFSDIDGTLCDCTRNLIDISEKTYYALKQLKEKAYLILVTGRPRCLVHKKLLEIKPDALILSNGAYGEINGKPIFHNPIRSLDYFRKYFKDNNGVYMFMNQNNCFVEDVNDKNVRNFIYSMSYNPDEILLNDDNVEYSDFVWIKSNKEEDRINIENDFNNNYLINRQQETTFDCVNKGVSKDRGIQEILKHIDFDYDTSYCFGDGLNDIGMMKIVDHSFAMGNAQDKTKEAADEVVDDVLDDGFYNTLVRLNIINPM